MQLSVNVVYLKDRNGVIVNPLEHGRSLKYSPSAVGLARGQKTDRSGFV